MPNETKKKTSFAVSDDTLKRLDELAGPKGRSRSNMVERLVKKAVARKARKIAAREKAR